MYKHRQQRKEEQSFHPAIAAFYFANAQDTSASTAHNLLQRDADLFARFAAITHYEKAWREAFTCVGDNGGYPLP